MKENQPSSASFTATVIAIVVILGGGSLAFWFAGRPPAKPTAPAAAELVKRVPFEEITKHNAAGNWQTTRSFPKAEVERLLAAGYRLVSVDETAGVVTLSR